MPRTPFLPNSCPKLVSAPPSGPEWQHERKFDGYRLQIHVQDGVPAEGGRGLTVAPGLLALAQQVFETVP